MNGRGESFRRACRGACAALWGAALAAAFAAALVLLLSSCSRTRTDAGDSLVLPDEVYGFRLGEQRAEVFARAEGNVRISPAPQPRGGNRGELYELSGTIRPYPGVCRVRLAFLDGRLMEVIVYFTDTSIANLETLRAMLEERCHAKAAAPDGTIETVWKTYRLSAPGMSITLRRIAKRTETELYIQYLHDGLHRKLIDQRGGGARG